mgnify:CR=1 FL=1
MIEILEHKQAFHIFTFQVLSLEYSYRNSITTTHTVPSRVLFCLLPVRSCCFLVHSSHTIGESNSHLGMKRDAGERSLQNVRERGGSESPGGGIPPQIEERCAREEMKTTSLLLLSPPRVLVRLRGRLPPALLMEKSTLFTEYPSIFP